MVICGFPGIGKTFTVQNWIYSNIKIYDSDSSNFSWIDKNDHSKGRNPDFPTNYIKSIDNENSVVLTSSHKEVRDALKAAGINYYVVYPNLESFGKDFYLDRIRGRENGINSDSFVSLIVKIGLEILKKQQIKKILLLLIKM